MRGRCLPDTICDVCGAAVPSHRLARHKKRRSCICGANRREILDRGGRCVIPALFNRLQRLGYTELEVAETAPYRQEHWVLGRAAAALDAIYALRSAGYIVNYYTAQGRRVEDKSCRRDISRAATNKLLQAGITGFSDSTRLALQRAETLRSWPTDEAERAAAWRIATDLLEEVSRIANCPVLVLRAGRKRGVYSAKREYVQCDRCNARVSPNGLAAHQKRNTCIAHANRRRLREVGAVFISDDHALRLKKLGFEAHLELVLTSPVRPYWWATGVAAVAARVLTMGRLIPNGTKRWSLIDRFISTEVLNNTEASQAVAAVLASVNGHWRGDLSATERQNVLQAASIISDVLGEPLINEREKLSDLPSV